jgi:hypothetical protein
MRLVEPPVQAMIRRAMATTTLALAMMVGLLAFPVVVVSLPQYFSLPTLHHLGLQSFMLLKHEQEMATEFPSCLIKISKWSSYSTSLATVASI